MHANPTADDLAQIRRALVALPGFLIADRRANLVTDAFRGVAGGSELVARMDINGPPGDVAAQIVEICHRHGDIGPTTALLILLSHAKNVADAAERAALDALFRKLSAPPPRAAPVTWDGTLLPYSCDRTAQHSLFRSRFRREWRRPDIAARAPVQVYIVCGRNPDQHESLARRLHHDVVRPTVEANGESSVAELIPGVIGFTETCSDDILDENIRNDIFEKFKLEYTPGESQEADELRRLLRKKKRQMYAIQFKVRRWDECADAFLRGQLRFWGRMTPTRTGPRFVVFVHFVYRSAAHAESVRNDIARVLADANVGDWCHLMDDLGRIEQDHVLNLFDENPLPGEISALSCARAMFRADNEAHDMACIETRLRHICDRINTAANPLAALPACVCEG